MKEGDRVSDADFHAATALALGQVLGEIASLVGLNPDDGELYPIVDRVRRLDAERQQWVREAFRLAERDGWSSFGTHVGGRSSELEFDGKDAGGMPLWERPKRARSSATEPTLDDAGLCEKCRQRDVHDPGRPHSIYGHFCLGCVEKCHDMSDESGIHECVIDRWRPRAAVAPSAGTKDSDG